jgi:hypothetical protein
LRFKTLACDGVLKDTDQPGIQDGRSSLPIIPTLFQALQELNPFPKLLDRCLIDALPVWAINSA